MKKIELNIIALANSESNPGNFALILEEQDSFRRLPVIIGPFEAQAIAIYLERLQPPRPMTHDLFKNTLDASGVELTEVLISDVIDGVFHARVIGTKADGSPLSVDARTSDAIALAVRFACPIYTTEAVMQSASIMLDNPSKAFSNKRGQLSDYTLEELERLLQQLLNKEDFESAARIRDAIAKKKG
ncbi:MAG: bifunctional nuclease family protein [Phaeodactylibacter sp.]|nr:bifunctional nuclease family protein [Phaeodactylibacter sp.]MCB9053577.1 bifunctional nuclease family protein [Lewinellaceae bacterium]